MNINKYIYVHMYLFAVAAALFQCYIIHIFIILTTINVPSFSIL
jgi:hypothetical protein